MGGTSFTELFESITTLRCFKVIPAPRMFRNCLGTTQQTTEEIIALALQSGLVSGVGGTATLYEGLIRPPLEVSDNVGQQNLRETAAATYEKLLLAVATKLADAGHQHGALAKAVDVATQPEPSTSCAPTGMLHSSFGHYGQTPKSGLTEEVDEKITPPIGVFSSTNTEDINIEGMKLLISVVESNPDRNEAHTSQTPDQLASGLEQPALNVPAEDDEESAVPGPDTEGSGETISLSLHNYVVANAEEDKTEAIRVLKEGHRVAIEELMKKIDSLTVKGNVLQKRVKKQVTASEKAKETIQELKLKVTEATAENDESRSIIDAKVNTILNLESRMRIATLDLLSQGETFKEEVDAVKETARQEEEEHAAEVRDLRAFTYALEEKMQSLRGAFFQVVEENERLAGVANTLQRAAAEADRTLERAYEESLDLRGEIHRLKSELEAMNDVHQRQMAENRRLVIENSSTERQTAQAEIRMLRQVVDGKVELVHRAERECEHYRTRNRELREQVAKIGNEVPQLKEDKDCLTFAKDAITKRLQEVYKEAEAKASEKAVLEERYVSLLKLSGQDAVTERLSDEVQMLMSNKESLITQLIAAKMGLAQAATEQKIVDRRCQTLEEKLSTQDVEKSELSEKVRKLDAAHLAVDVEHSVLEKENGLLKESISKLESSETALKAELAERDQALVRLAKDRSRDSRFIQERWGRYEITNQNFQRACEMQRTQLDEEKAKVTYYVNVFNHIQGNYDIVEAGYNHLRIRADETEGWRKYEELRAEVEARRRGMEVFEEA